MTGEGKLTRWIMRNVEDESLDELYEALSEGEPEG